MILKNEELSQLPIGKLLEKKDQQLKEIDEQFDKD